jgi:hypothetical protein
VVPFTPSHRSIHLLNLKSSVHLPCAEAESPLSHVPSSDYCTIQLFQYSSGDGDFTGNSACGLAISSPPPPTTESSRAPRERSTMIHPVQYIILYCCCCIPTGTRHLVVSYSLVLTPHHQLRLPLRFAVRPEAGRGTRSFSLPCRHRVGSASALYRTVHRTERTQASSSPAPRILSRSENPMSYIRYPGYMIFAYV